MTNVLVTSISKKVPMIKSVRSAIERVGIPSLLYGSDLSADCIGQYFVDRFWKAPILSDADPQDLIAYCKKENISVIFPSRDGELLYFANVKEEFKKNGISVMISNADSVRICIDKKLFYEKLSEAGFPVIPTSTDYNQDWVKWVVKERYGAASANIGLNLTRDRAIQHASNMTSPIFQPMIRGNEYSIDVYVNTGGKAVGALVRSRDKVVQGESQITSTKPYPVLEHLCMEAAEHLGLQGHVIFQVLIDSYHKVHFIECNCRFGGASTLSLAMGLDSFRWFIMESLDSDAGHIYFERSAKDKKMIRHPEDLII